MHPQLTATAQQKALKLFISAALFQRLVGVPRCMHTLLMCHVGVAQHAHASSTQRGKSAAATNTLRA
jgi:hypothetical protein